MHRSSSRCPHSPRAREASVIRTAGPSQPRQRLSKSPTRFPLAPAAPSQGHSDADPSRHLQSLHVPWKSGLSPAPPQVRYGSVPPGPSGVPTGDFCTHARSPLSVPQGGRPFERTRQPHGSVQKPDGPVALVVPARGNLGDTVVGADMRFAGAAAPPVCPVLVTKTRGVGASGRAAGRVAGTVIATGPWSFASSPDNLQIKPVGTFSLSCRPRLGGGGGFDAVLFFERKGRPQASRTRPAYHRADPP